MLRTKVTKETLAYHFRYYAWAYIILIILCACLWSVLYNKTEYQPPEDKVLEVTIVGEYVPQSSLDYYEEKAWEILPDMEEISFGNIMLDLTGEEGDYSGYQKLQVVIAVGEGDIYLLTKEQMKIYAEYEAFIPLDEALAEGGALYGLFTEEEIEQGTLLIEDSSDGLAHCYALPMSRMEGLAAQGLATDDLYMCLMTMSGNQENALKLMAWLGQQTEPDAPSWITTEEEAVPEEETEEGAALPEIG